MAKRIISIANQKGGVGKTTTAINLAASLAWSGQRVLFIDIDPQGNGTSGLGIEQEQIQKTIYDIFIEKNIADNTIIASDVENLDVIASEADLFGIDVELMKVSRKEFILKDVLETIADQYDFIVIDCPPSLSMLTVNALTASDGIIIPVQCQYFALEGLSQLLQTVELFREALNPHLEIDGFLPTMFEEDNPLAQSVVEEVQQHFPDKIFKAIIKKDRMLSEAPSHGKSILFYDIRSIGADQYIQLAEEVLEKYELMGV